MKIDRKGDVDKQAVQRQYKDSTKTDGEAEVKPEECKNEKEKVEKNQI